jgi:hypothetical protein
MIFNYGYNAAKNNAQSKIDDAKAETGWNSVMDTDINEDGTIDAKDIVKLHEKTSEVFEDNDSLI